LGLDNPNLLPRKNCFGQRKYLVNDDAESRVLVLLSGPPEGGVPKGISINFHESNE
jgi:hypothetical protein